MAVAHDGVVLRNVRGREFFSHLVNLCPCGLIYVFARSGESKDYSSQSRQSVVVQFLWMCFTSTCSSAVLNGGRFAMRQVMELRGLIGSSNKVRASGSHKTSQV